MAAETTHNMPSFEALWESYKCLREDAELDAIRNWTLPNSAKETDENVVYERAMAEDDRSFFMRAVDIVIRMKRNGSAQ